MSFQGKKGGGGNPFARGGQPAPSGGGQNNAPRGNPGGGRGGGANNPFATKPANTPPQAPNYQQNYQPNNNASQWHAQSQRPQAGKQNVNFGGAPVKTNSNPFAQQGNSTGGFGGSSGGMEMDSSNGGNAVQRTISNFPNHNSGGKVVSNPFAASGQQQAVNPSSNMFGANNNNAMMGQNFGGGNQFQQPAAVVKQNPFFAGGAPQQQQPQQHQQGQGMFNANANQFQQQQPQQPQFAGGFQNRGFQQTAARPVAPVRAEVNAQALSAVNMSAALAPSQVEEIDLGLGMGGGSLHDGGTAGPALGHNSSAFPPQPVAAVASAGDSSGDQEVAKMIALLDGILAGSPLQGLSEEAPSEQDVHQLLQGGALVAGRVPAAPPARSTQQQTQSMGAASNGIRQGQQANPFSNSSGGAVKANSIFGVKQ